jgi:hypothetical protein
MRFPEVIASPRFGEVRWADIAGQVERGVAEIEVFVVAQGAAPAQMKLQVAERWAGAGWCRQFACPGCGAGARVLRYWAGGLLCSRCRPRRTARQRERTTAWWNRYDGRLEDELLRLLICGRRADSNKPIKLASTLVQRDEARAEAVVQSAEGLVRAIDEVVVRVQIPDRMDVQAASRSSHETASWVRAGTGCAARVSPRRAT